MFLKKDIFGYSALLFILFFSSTSVSQILNSEIVAKIKVDKTSEFYKFTAIGANLTPFDQSLRYEFLVFKTDENDNTSKSSQGDRFTLKSNYQQVLSTLTINYSVEAKVILALIIYDVDDKPVGQDRIVLEEGGKTVLEVTPQNTSNSADEAAPQDGVFPKGLIIENTITKVGRDFYRYFSQDYNLRGIFTDNNILIEEVPGRSRNTRISIKVEGTLVWQFFAQPAKKFLMQMKDITMSRVIRQLQYLERQKNTKTRY